MRYAHAGNPRLKDTGWMGHRLWAQPSRATVQLEVRKKRRERPSVEERPGQSRAPYRNRTDDLRITRGPVAARERSTCNDARGAVHREHWFRRSRRAIVSKSMSKSAYVGPALRHGIAGR